MAFTSQLGIAESQLANISLGVSAGPGTKNASASDTLTFTESLAANFNELIDTITFDEDLIYTVIWERSISDMLILTEIVSPTYLSDFEDTLVFTDEAVAFKEFTDSIPEAIDIVETLSVQLTSLRTLAEGLEFVEVAQRNIVKLLEILESITFTEDMQGFNVKLAQDILAFTEDLQYFTAKLIRESLEFGDITNVNVNYQRLTADVFEPYDTISVELFIRRTLEDTLTLSDTVSGERVTPLNDSITFSESIDENVSKSTSDTLSLSDVLAVIKIKTISTSDLLNFTDAASTNLVITKALEDSLTLLESLSHLRLRFYEINDSFAFSETLYREIRVALAPDTFEFTEEILANRISVINLTDTITFNDTLNVNVVINQSISESLSFFEAPPSDIFPNTSAVGSYATIYNKMMTIIGKTKSIALPPPEFNDFYADRNQVIFKRRMNGAVATYVKTCPENKVHYEFILSRPKANELRSFFDAEHSNQLIIYDWNGYIWISKLLTDAIDKEEFARWEPCGNKTRVTVEFIGHRYA